MTDGYLEKNRRLIDRELKKRLPGGAAKPRLLHKAMRYGVLGGGKRIRPMLVLESSKACGGNLKDALPVACAVEIIHSYSLIHDDLPSMDDALTRRGRPSCHVKYGEATAILAGDALLSLAFYLISGRGGNPNMGRVAREISGAIGSFGMAGGQSMDLEMKNGGRPDLRALMRVNGKKTGALIAAAARSGGMIAGAGRDKIEALGKYGEDIGLAFQITDDILDKDGYADIFGVSGSRDESRKLAERAKARLRIFGKKADGLRAIADYTLNRKR